MSDGDDWLHDVPPEDTSCHDDMKREWNSRRREFHVSGMRDGYEAGKEETVQEGFDQGMHPYHRFTSQCIDYHVITNL